MLGYIENMSGYFCAECGAPARSQRLPCRELNQIDAAGTRTLSGGAPASRRTPLDDAATLREKIETVAAKSPEKIIREPVDPLAGLQLFQTRKLAKQLGFAPVKLGKFDEGGALVHARGRTWGRLIFQDLFKKEL